VIEAMGRHANVILLSSAGQVLDAIKRVTPRMSRVRPILPGRAYVRPPRQAKLDPPDLTPLRLGEMLDASPPDQPIWRMLVRQVRATSPLLAREVVHRATGSTETAVEMLIDPGARGRAHPPLLAPLCGAFHELWSSLWGHDWQPVVALQGGRAVAYAPYRLTQYERIEPAATISEAIERFETAQGHDDVDASTAETSPGPDPYAAARARVRAFLRDARERVMARQRALKREQVSPEERERLCLCGEMILAYAHAIQRGADRLQAQVDLDGPPLIIDLDPQLTPVENAQAYFARYEKARSAAHEIPALLSRAEAELVYLDQLASDLQLASNRPEIDEVYTALQEAGYIPQQRGPRPQRGEPLRVQTDEGFEILVGRSARQNHELTFRRAASDDLWLHAVDAPGSHVIVHSGGRAIPETVLRRAAALAAHYSARRSDDSVLVAYTLRRYVRPIPPDPRWTSGLGHVSQ